MKKTLFSTMLVLTLFVFSMSVFLLPAAAANVNMMDDLGKVGNEGGLPDKSLPEMVGGIINALLGILGVVLVIIIVIGGTIYMTAGGDTSKVEKGVLWMKNGIIGLVIVLAAYAISTFVVSKLQQAAMNP